MIVDRLFHRAGIERSVTLEVVDVGSALDMVRAELGLAFVPEEALVDRHDLAQVDLRRPPPRVSLVLASLDDRPPLEATRPCATPCLSEPDFEALETTTEHLKRL